MVSIVLVELVDLAQLIAQKMIAEEFSVERSSVTRLSEEIAARQPYMLSHLQTFNNGVELGKCLPAKLGPALVATVFDA